MSISEVDLIIGILVIIITTALYFYFLSTKEEQTLQQQKDKKKEKKVENLNKTIKETKKVRNTSVVNDNNNNNTITPAASNSNPIETLKQPFNYDKWNNIDEDIELVEKEEEETKAKSKSTIDKKKKASSARNKKNITMSTSLVNFVDSNNIFDGTNFDPNNSVFNGDENLMKKILSLDENSFCKFFEVQLKQLPTTRDNNYIGLSFQPPVKEASKNKNKTSSNNLLADGDKTKSNNKNKKKVVENVNEVKDLAPLLYTCLSLHIGKPEAQKAMNYFSGIEAQYLNSLSLDDIEEIASIKQEGES